MRRVLIPLIAAAAVWAAAPASAAGWTVTIREPAAGEDGYAPVRGEFPVQASVSDGVGEATSAAYHLRPSGGSWTEAGAVAMDRVGERDFAAAAPIRSGELPNGIYELEVRVWGEVPRYRPGNPSTFSSAVVEVRVDNPPAPPRDPAGGTTIGAYRVAWTAPAAAGRQDFAGYRVLMRRGGCSGNPADYAVAGETEETSLYVGAEPARYCVKIQSLRTSPVSGVVASAPSPPLRIRVPASSVGAPYAKGQSPPEPPPSAPSLGDGELIVSDKPFGEDLPYGSKTVTEKIAGEDGTAAGDTDELGPDPRQAPLAIATGLLMTVTALLLRRFLRQAPT